MKKGLQYGLIGLGAIASILLFLLALASENTGFLDAYYDTLLLLNIGAAGALLLFVLVALARLYVRYRNGKFGSRLMARLMFMFAAIGVLPGLVIFLVSLNIVTGSIESWFNVKIEAALSSGLNLGQAALDQAQAELVSNGGVVAATLAGQQASDAQLVLKRALADGDGMQSAILVDAEGRLLSAAAEDPRANLAAEVPTAAMLRQAGMPGGYARAEGGIDRDLQDERRASAPPVNGLDAATGLRLRVVLAVPEPPGRAPRYLQLLQSVPVKLAANAEVLRAAYSEYEERKVSRKGLKKMYSDTLTLAMLLAIFGAVASAILIASNLAQPLLVLAEGTRAVAEGDLSPRPIVATNDELGTLTQSFNTMTGQLFEARSAVERNRAALQSAKAHLESVLGNMSAGVIVLNADFVVVNSNEAVERILQHDVGGHLGTPLSAIEGLEVFASAVMRAFSTQSAQSAAGSARKSSHWQKEIEVPRRLGSAEDHDITLLARGSRLPVGAGNGYIVVFDDISDVISAQRSIAWGEVARRLAHEIKNPLTPIQLSAERRQM
ncbi:MAG: HAMP domain-containing protein, partial [Massilia sp.]